MAEQETPKLISDYFACSNCGESPAPEGSMKHPYCKKCWLEVWKGDFMAYVKWLHETHY